MTEEFDDIELMDADTDSDGQLYEHLRMEVDRGQEPVRIDKYMSEHVQHSSRNRIQKAADAGFIQVNGKPVKSNYKVRPGDVITLMLDRPHYDTTIEPEDIPLDVVYEDDQLMVINKPAGLVVHPGVGNFHGTLVNAIAWHLRNLPSYDPNDPSVGLVHRIDKDTSGLLVIAKTPEAKTELGAQFFNHDTHRSYQALVWGNFTEDTGRIEGNIGRDPKDRQRMAVCTPDGTRRLVKSWTHRKGRHDTWTFNQEEFLREHYPTHSAAELSAYLGRRENAIQYKAHRMGLKKAYIPGRKGYKPIEQYYDNKTFKPTQII